jgi:hypothetical protein
VLSAWKVKSLLHYYTAYANIKTVAGALVRYINSGVTLGAVNFPEVNLRSLTLDEPNHARVSSSKPWSRFMLSAIGHIYPQKCSWCFEKRYALYGDFQLVVTDFTAVNEILGDHNVDKQTTDNKGDVSLKEYPMENDYSRLILDRLPISWPTLAMCVPAI